MDIHIRVNLGPRFVRGVLTAALLLANVGELASESVTLTTYYPAPSGVYNKLLSTADAYFSTQGGNVGVGTFFPGSKLNVNGAIVAGGVGAPPGTEPYTSLGSGSGISFADRAGGANPRWVIYPNGGTLLFWNQNTGPLTGITSAGNVGIGTTAPTTKLDVIGTIQGTTVLGCVYQ